MIRAPQRGVERGVWLALKVAEAVPVVGAVLRHRQQVPSLIGNILVEVGNQRPIGDIAKAVVGAIPQSRHLIESWHRRFQRFDEADQCVHTFAARHKIGVFLAQSAFGQRRHMAADENDVAR